MNIHREGHKILLSAAVGLVVLNLGLWYVSMGYHMRMAIIIASVLLFLFISYFFRKPRRIHLIDQQYVVSPADGKIVAVEEVHETEYFKEKRLLVSIFMSPSNVHINWNPISGMVKYVKYHPGRYFVAYNPKSSTLNERNTMVIEGDGVEILVRQIAGLLARRIVHYVNVGEEVKQGSEFGFIKFGSRVDLFLPLDAEIMVDLRQKVKGGKTVIARIS